MRILLISSYYPPGIGGAPRLLEGYVRHFLEEGHEVEVVCFGAPMYPAYASFDTLQAYRIHRVRASQMRNSEIAKMALRVLLLAIGRTISGRNSYDLLFCGVAYPCAIMAQMVARLLGTPYIVYCHGEDALVVKGYPRKEALLRDATRNASTVFANSRFTLLKLVELGCPEQLCQLLPPGIDPNPFLQAKRSDVQALRTRLGLEGKRILLTIARLTSPRKGHDTVIRVLPALAQEFPDLHYVVVGQGDPSVLQALSSELGVATRLTIIPELSGDDLVSIYHLSEIYVMPSRFDPDIQEVEGFGMVYLEAAAASKPSVAGTAGGAVDAVEHGTTGLCVNPESLQEVTEAIRTLLADPEYARNLGEAGKARLLAGYTSDVLASRLDAAVASAVSAKKRK